jgi:ADP-ribosylglycohydrolase
MAPAGLFYDPQTAYKSGCEFSAITHGHPTGITAGGAFAMLISYLRHGKSLAAALDLVEKHLKNIPDAAETLVAMRRAKTAKSITELGEGWVAEEALSIGIYCALHNEFDFRSGVLEAVNISGDSDSTGAICGNLLGARLGIDGIPEKYRQDLEMSDLILRLADEIHATLKDE